MRKLKRWQIPLFAFASFGPCILFMGLANAACNLLPKEYDQLGKK